MKMTLLRWGDTHFNNGVYRAGWMNSGLPADPGVGS